MTPRPSKLTQATRRELELVIGDRVVVAAVVTVSRAQVHRYSQFGLRFKHDGIVTGEPAPPLRECGLSARRNLDGWDDKRMDLAKEPREISTWAPNWHGSGYHLVSRTIEAWPVEHHDARMLTISAAVLEPSTKDGGSVRFRVDQPLHRGDSNFARDLAFNMRLLREAVGEARIYDADLTDDDYALIQRVDWEFLPRGSAEKVLKRLAASRGANKAKMQVAAERIRVLDRLDHDGFIVGVGKFARYFGAKFGTRLVALENLEYGNAMYLFEENWETLTQLTRTDLIRRRDPSVHRIPHVRGWQSAVRRLLQGK